MMTGNMDGKGKGNSIKDRMKKDSDTREVESNQHPYVLRSDRH